MPATDSLTTSFVVEIDGAALAPGHVAAIRAITVEKGWSAVDRLVLEFDGDDVPTTIKMGSAVVVKLTAPVAKPPVTGAIFKGEIVGQSVRWSEGVHNVVFEALDKRHRLARKIVPKTYAEVTLAAVVSDIAKANKLQSQVPQALMTRTFPHLIVADSHFAVLQHIARRTGSVWSLDDEKITFALLTDRAQVELEVKPPQLVDFDLRFTPVERPSNVEVHGWDQPNGALFTGSAAWSEKGLHRPPDALGAATSLAEEDAAVTWSAAPLNVGDASDMAAALARRMQTAEITARGTVEADPRMAPGVSVKVGGVSPTVNGTYRVESVVHRMGRSFQSAITEFRIGSNQDSLTDLVGGHAGSLGSAPPGVTIGVVTATNDISRQGRVRLKLPLLSDDLQTGWVRMAGIGSGSNRGIAFVPEVNDEVLVAFEHGELNRPYVIGGLWNKSGGTFANLAKDNKTEERSLTSKLGSKLRFVDIQKGDAKSGIVLEMDDATTRIFLGYKQVMIETQGRPLEIKNGNASILMDKDNITIKGQKVTIEAQNEISLDAKVNAKIKAGAAAEVEGVSVKVAGKSSATLESAANTTIKGSMVQVN